MQLSEFFVLLYGYSDMLRLSFRKWLDMRYVHNQSLALYCLFKYLILSTNYLLSILHQFVKDVSTLHQFNM